MRCDIWSYRTHIIDSSVRCGKYEMGRDRIDLPLLIDTESQVSLHTDLTIETSSVTGEPDLNPLSNAVKNLLERHKAREMEGAIGYRRNIIRAGRKGDLHDVPVLSDRMATILLQDPNNLAEVIYDIGDRHPLHDPIHIPGAGGWDDLEALFFMGIEIFDTSRAILDGFNGIYYTMTSHLDRIDVERVGGPSAICSCDVCQKMSDGFDGSKIGAHNSEMVKKRLILLRAMLLRGDLRQHVMGIISGKPRWMSALRRNDSLHTRGKMISTWTWRKQNRVPVTYREDFFYPDFNLWRKRIWEDYHPLPHKRILLLLPCSARKPYSTSRTHIEINSALSSERRWKVAAQRVILTSPLGAVPMELEDLYPASYYDLPVTGEWFPEEVEMMRKLTDSIVSKGDFQSIICYHMEGGEIFPEPTDKGFLGSIPFINIHRMATEEDIPPKQMLKKVMRTEMIGPDGVGSADNIVLEALNQIRFSLDADIDHEGEFFVKRTRKGVELRSGKIPLFTLGKGGPVPTLKGARMMWERGIGRRVEIDDFTPKGTLFTQGINRATPEIRPGDIVTVGSKRELKGLGRALIPGRMMNKGIRGDGVKMIVHGKDRS